MKSGCSTPLRILPITEKDWASALYNNLIGHFKQTAFRHKYRLL